MVICLVYQFEKSHAIFLLDFFAGGVFLDLQVVAFLHYFGYPHIFLGNGVGHFHVEFHPVGLFGEAHAFHMLRIIGVIIDGGHGAYLLEPFDKHSFVVHVGESHRSYDGFHPFGAPPFAYGVEKRVGHFGVILEVHEPETQAFLAGTLVYLMVDYAGDASHRLAVAVSHE